MSSVVSESGSRGGHRGFTAKGIASFFTGMLAAYRRRAQKRQVQRHLESLDDRLLADIGLNRADIPAAVEGGREPR